MAPLYVDGPIGYPAGKSGERTRAFGFPELSEPANFDPHSSSLSKLKLARPPSQLPLWGEMFGP
eukprot:12762483-Prorocentrum_lima.AAC.1